MATTTTLHHHHHSPLQFPLLLHSTTICPIRSRKPNMDRNLLIHCNPRNPRPGCRVDRFSVVRSGALGRDLEGGGAPTSVPVRVAVELIQAGHRYLDVRTPEEFSAGHVPGAVNVPYLLKFGSGMVKNNSFLEGVASAFGKDDEIIVVRIFTIHHLSFYYMYASYSSLFFQGCQSGKRSLMAAAVLLSAGYTNITDVAGGYAAWLENGLPTE
ncbi:Rhodanese-like domain-containing protein [Drosera capensis]